jgi:hypothetical protein
MLSATNNNPLDHIGMVASCACAIHCALTPFIIGLLPFMGLSLLADPLTEWSFVGVSVAVSISSLLPSYLRRHRQAKPLVILAGGFCLILAARVVFEANLSAEIPIVVIGALLIATSHLMNRRLCQACIVCSESCGEEPASSAPCAFHTTETTVQRHAAELR